jgi:hypothetical protein
LSEELSKLQKEFSLLIENSADHQQGDEDGMPVLSR